MTLLEDWRPPTRYTVTAGSSTRTLPCQCGGSVRADVRFPAYGVANHQRTRLHRAWRERVGL